MKQLPKFVTMEFRAIRAALRKHLERQKKVKLDLESLERRVEQLERDTSPHKRAGYD